MFHEVIVPLIGMESSMLGMISTPVDTYNFFTKLMDMKDQNGNPLFIVVDMVLSCPRCQRLNRPTKCTHRYKYLPPWKSPDKQEIMNTIMRDQETILARENYGLVSDEGESYIPKKFVDRWLNSERFVPIEKQTAPMVVTTMDLNGSGAANCSEQSLVSIAMMYGVYVVSDERGGASRASNRTFPKSVSTPTAMMYWMRTSRTNALMSGLLVFPQNMSMQSLSRKSL